MGDIKHDGVENFVSNKSKFLKKNFYSKKFFMFFNLRIKE